MYGFEVIEYRFCVASDKYDDLYLENWSRPYEYKYVMDFILAHRKEGMRIHNTSCGGHHNVHNLFRYELDKVADTLHSDIKVSQPHPTYKYDVTKEKKELEGKFDFVLNVSTLEHLPSGRIAAIKNLYKQVKPGGYLVITFDYPKITINDLYPLLGVKCKKPKDAMTGLNSVSHNPKALHEIVFLVLHKPLNDLAVFVDESSLFAAPFLAEALDCPLYVMYTQYNNFFGHGKPGMYWNEGKAINAKDLIIIGYNALRAIADRKLEKRFNSIALILSDSWTCKYHKWINKWVNEKGVPVYCSHDMHDYLNCNQITAYHTIRLKESYFEKPTDRLIISHSPSGDIKYRVKGSKELIEIMNRLKKIYDFEFRLIKDKTMDECVRLKGESHIFVDNFVHKNPNVPQDRFGGEIRYEGALSKSGIEAMMLECCVFTGAPEPEDNATFPRPPVIWCSYENFEEQLIEIIENEFERNRIAYMQKIWVDKYCSPKFVARHVTQHLR